MPQKLKSRACHAVARRVEISGLPAGTSTRAG